MSDEEDFEFEMDEEGVYVWTSNGGCAACDAMEGEYDEEPQRFHEFCDCEITVERKEPPDSPACADDVSYELNDVTVEVSGDPDDFNFNPDDTVTIIFSFTITCYDGNTFDEDIEIEITLDEYLSDSGSVEEMYLAEALEQLETIAYDECEPCESPVLE